MKHYRTNLKILLFCALLFVMTGFTAPSGCGKDSAPNIPDAVQKVARSGIGQVLITTETGQATPFGVRVYSKDGLSAKTLELFEQGVSTAFAGAKDEGFTEKIEFGFYEVYTPPYQCLRSPETQTPSFLVRANPDPWDGSVYDQYNPQGVGKKDGVAVVFASEMILSLGTDGSTYKIGQMYVCPDESVASNAAQYGVEHIALANNPYNQKVNPQMKYNDGWTYFNCSVFHENNINHPLLPRNKRCFSNTEETKIREPAITENPLSPEIADTAKQFGYKGEIETRTGFVITAVR